MRFLYVLFASAVFFSCSFSNEASIQKAYDNLTLDKKLAPENAVAGLKIAEDLEVQLFASEPMITNPTNMDIDARGRVWVCEGFNYRNKLNPKNPYRNAGDRIVILEDINGDGKADTSKVFYQGEDINAALGIAVLGNKVIVSAAPNVFVFTDSNGDDLPDKKELLFTGIGGLQHDHAVHAFVFGPDGKLYFNFGNAGEQLLDKNGKPVKDINGVLINNRGKPFREGMAFRCNIDGSEVEVLGHNFRNNFELAVDAFGRVWQSDNDDDGNKAVRINYVMNGGNFGYTDQLTGEGWGSRRINMEDSIPLRHWHLNDPGVVPNLLQTGSGSPTGMIVYEGKDLPTVYRNQIIHCDAGPRTVRAYPVEKDRSGYKATIQPMIDARPGNNWFRPSDVTAAPDGSIFVSDWFDPGVGGHAAKDTLRGRIFRVSKSGNGKYISPTLDLNTLEGLVAAIQSPNQAIRFLGFETILKAGTKYEKDLGDYLKKGQMRDRARLIAAMAKVPGLERKYTEIALGADEEDLRILGLKLLGTQKGMPVDSLVYPQAERRSSQIRREAALALKDQNTPLSASIWLTIAGQHEGQDRWYLEALGIAADGKWDTYMPAWFKAVGNRWNKTEANKEVVWRSRSSETGEHLIELIKEAKDADAAKYFRALDFVPYKNKTKDLLAIFEDASPQIKLLIAKSLDANTPGLGLKINSLIKDIKNPYDLFDVVSKYGLKSESDRLATMAITFADSTLGRDAARTLLKSGGMAKAISMLQDNKNQATALDVFGGKEDPELLNAFAAIVKDPKTPDAIKIKAVDALHSYQGDAFTFAKLVKTNALSADLKARALRNLTFSWNGDIRKEAAQMLYPNQKPLTDIEIAEILKTKGDVSLGKKTFEASCAICHQVGEKGVNFGPGLDQIAAKYGKDGLLNAIIYPANGISFGFENHLLKLRDGTELQGIVVARTDENLQFKITGSAEIQTYNWSKVKNLNELLDSPMPALPLPKKEMSDLLEYLSGLK